MSEKTKPAEDNWDDEDSGWDEPVKKEPGWKTTAKTALKALADWRTQRDRKLMKAITFDQLDLADLPLVGKGYKEGENTLMGKLGGMTGYGVGSAGSGYATGMGLARFFPTISKTVKGRQALQAILAATEGAVRDPLPGEDRSTNAAKNALLSVILGGGLESIMAGTGPISRTLARVLGGLSKQEAAIHRSNPEEAQRLASASVRQPDTLNKDVETILEGNRVSGGYDEGALSRLDENYLTPRKLAKDEILSRFGVDASFPLDQFEGTSPEFQRELGRISAARSGFPRVREGVAYSEPRLNIFREKGPGTPIHQMITDETRFERVIPPRQPNNVVLTPAQQSQLMEIAGQNAYRKAQKLGQVVYDPVQEASALADAKAFAEIRKAQELGALSKQKSVNASTVGSIDTPLMERERLRFEREYNPENKYKMSGYSALDLPELNDELNTGLNYKQYIEGLGNTRSSLLSAGEGTPGQAARRYLDKKAGTKLEKMALALSSGKKLSMDRAVPSPSSFPRKGLSRYFLDTRNFTPAEKTALDLSALETMLNLKRPNKSSMVDDTSDWDE